MGAIRSLATFLLTVLSVTTAGRNVRPQTLSRAGSAAEVDAKVKDTTPPRLVSAKEVSYPEGILPEAREVLLELLIGKTGSVDAVTVVKSAGAAFDEAIVTAVRAFEFEPARVAETPVPALIRYRFVIEEFESTSQTEASHQATAPAVESEPAGAPPVPPQHAEVPVFSATAEVSAPAKEPTRYSLTREQLDIVPGTRGDALRAVEILPGVGRTPFAGNDGPPILRGVSPSNSLVLLDGAPVPLLFHFGGLTSFFNSQLLQAVDVYPSNVSSRYGRLNGGVVEARVLRHHPVQPEAKLELSLIDSWGLVKAPLSPRTSVAFAARRSNIDLAFEHFIPEDTFSVVGAPVYYDYQALVQHEVSSEHELSLLAYGARDTLNLVFSQPNADDPALRDQLEGLLEFHRVQAHWVSRPSRSVEHRLMVSAGPERLRQRLGPLDAELSGMDLHARSDWSLFFAQRARVDAGIDWFSQFLSGHYRGPKPTQEEGNPTVNDRLGGEQLYEVQASFHVLRPSAYAELAYQPVSGLSLQPGVRLDYYEEFDEWAVDPRLMMRTALDEHTVVQSGVGLYSQPPEYYQQFEELGNPELGAQRSMQFSLGTEHQASEQLSLKVEAFYQRLFDRIVATEGGAPPSFENNGSGRIVGFEGVAQWRPSPRTFGYLAYTLSRSERRDNDQPFRLFDQDQTHNLSFTASYELGRGWLAGARFRYVSGNPFTRVTAAVYDATTDIYRPLYGPINSARHPAFHQLDLRLEKRWELGPVVLAAYLEVLNAYNAQNVEGQRYSYNYRKSEAVTGLPFFPNLGLRGEL